MISLDEGLSLMLAQAHPLEGERVGLEAAFIISFALSVLPVFR